MAINIRLRTARVAQGLTQLQLAEQIGTKEIEISRWETGRTQPSQEMRQRLSSALGKPTYELFHT